MPPRLSAAARLIPVLLHASFEKDGLEGDAPGVAGLRYRRRWSSLSRAFGLPPPCRAQRGRCLVEAVLVVPRGTWLEVLALIAPGHRDEEAVAVERRLSAIEGILGTAAPVGTTVVNPARLEEDPARTHRLITFGALAAGRLSSEAWTALESVRGRMPPSAVAALAAQAPGPLATLCLTLMTRTACMGPLDAALALLVSGETPRALASPEMFCLRWARLVPGISEILFEPFLEAGTARPPAEHDELWRFLEKARALGLDCARAVHSSRFGERDPSGRRRWLEALGPGIPHVLLPALGALFAAEARRRPLSLDPVRVRGGYEVRLADGTPLGRGASAVQARIRALGLVAATEAARPNSARPGREPLLALSDPTWRELGARLSRPTNGTTRLLTVVAGSGARQGSPTDPLNRGPERALDFDGALSVLLAPGRRPSGRVLSPEEAMRAVLHGSRSGGALEILAAEGSARPVAARLSRIAALVREATSERPVAVEAGGRVHFVEGRRVRVFALERFAARPRVFTPDLEAPDISIASGRREGFSSRRAGVVQCRVVALDGESAALLYADGASNYLREVVPYAEMEGRLGEARMVLRTAQTPAVLVVLFSEGLELAARHLPPAAEGVEIAVFGSLPFVEVEIGGERFGGSSRLSWSAAAEALLSRWPPGGEGRVSVKNVSVTLGGKPVSPLYALYASAVARRRLRSHLGRTLLSYRNAHAGRREA
ncbi:MAG TPA: hypothetical protein VLV17_04000 [Anaeromyxobacteraceae bacterium]|nr:hypothetical protein [Anaeromyxobacteraceae bacterium]